MLEVCFEGQGRKDGFHEQEMSEGDFCERHEIIEGLCLQEER